MSKEPTIEDPSVTSPAERMRLFGQEDHVRLYGPDYPDRLKAVGFRTHLIAPQDFLSKEDCLLMGITSEAGDIVFCEKGRPEPPSMG